MKHQVVTTSVRIWDVPIRVVHWAMVVLVALAWWTVQNGYMAWHYRFGFALLGLLVFRLIWGFAGSSTARFRSFVRGPRGVLEYVRGSRNHGHGHNPLGALSILALLGDLAVQVGTGLFASNRSGSKAGPFADLISQSAAHAVTAIHQANFNILLALIGLHVVAVLYFLVARGQDLIVPMFTGRRHAPAGTPALRSAPALTVILAVVAATGVALWVSTN